MIKNGKDFWAGAMFIAFGIAFMVVSRDYSMGSSVRMGPAYFPTMLGGLLVALGAVVFVRAFVSQLRQSFAVFRFRWGLAIAGTVLGVVMYQSFAWWVAMGKGPQLLQYVLNALALILIVLSFGPKPLFVITLAVIAFGYLLKPFGLVITSAILIFASAWGGHEFKAREVLIIYVVLALFSVGTFVFGLGLPINIWPDLG